jgi:hypothetical protein
MIACQILVLGGFIGESLVDLQKRISQARCYRRQRPGNGQRRGRAPVAAIVAWFNHPAS